LVFRGHHLVFVLSAFVLPQPPTQRQEFQHQEHNSQQLMQDQENLHDQDYEDNVDFKSLAFIIMQ
jgi:hypothetical protein